MPAASPSVRHDGFGVELAVRATELALRPLQVLASVPSLLFLAALTAMLLRPPFPFLFEIDRLAFGLFVVGVTVRVVVMRERLFAFRATWPMIGLSALATASLLFRPFDSEAWSVLAAKFLVPFTLFHLAALVFTHERRLRQFEVFALAVLAYLSFIAIAFLAGMHSLIFPRFIVDESLGYHLDRARGPFLQAVANGMSLNLLGLLALHAYRRGSVRGAKMVLLLASVPIAILATMTRTVWLSFAGSVMALVFVSRDRKVRRACVGLTLVTAAGLAVVVTSTAMLGALTDRVEERGPIEYRAAVYAGSWQMFLERPLTGWGFHQMPAELPRYVSGYDEKVLYPHNTYLEMLVEQGGWA
jgi:O-antigen ligase